MTGNEEGNIPGFHIAAFLDFLTVFCGQDGMYVDLHQFIHEGLAVREESPMAKTKIRQATGSRPATLSRSSRESIAAASWTVCSNSDLMDETIAADDPGIPNGRDNILTDTSCCLALSEHSRRPAAKPASCRTRIFEPPATPWPVTRRLRRRCPRESCLRFPSLVLQIVCLLLPSRGNPVWFRAFDMFMASPWSRPDQPWPDAGQGYSGGRFLAFPVSGCCLQSLAEYKKQDD